MSLPDLSRLAVLYSLPPSQLGFCGPREKQRRKLLTDFALGKNIPSVKVRRVMEKFEALYPYLRLIASSNGIKDPFADPVLKAFWVGNKLLDNVKVKDLRQLIVTDFTKPGLLSKEEAKKRAAQVKEGMVPHHSFHVLFLGSITGRVKLEGALKELCRISWGKVVEVQSSKLKVKSRPLVLAKKMKLGEEIEKEVDWDSKMVPGVKVGNWVSFHWGQVCDLLSKKDIENLTHYTQKVISLIPSK